MSVSNLQPNSNYKIIELKEVKTKYGENYIMTDSELNQYWTNKKIATFIKQNKIPLSNNSKVLFKIKTNNYKTFTTKDGDEIKFLELCLVKC